MHRPSRKLGTLLNLTIATTLLILAASNLYAGTGDVVNSPHNLSASGPGPVKSSESQVCIFCHAPHNVTPDVKPLWNKSIPTTSYTPYSSATMSAAPVQPSIISKQCLSCHDGTIALGQTLSNGTIPTSGSLSTAKNLTSDLRNDHPVSFNLSNNGQLAPSLFQGQPATLDSTVHLVAGKVECTTCHEPHKVDIDVVARKFLVRSNSAGGLCLACHDPSRPQPNDLNGWTSGAHSSATNATAGAASVGPYGTVGGNGCESCHMPHNSVGTGARLLRGVEEATCATCHSATNLTPATRNVMAEFNKTYKHPTTTVSGAHDPAENAFPLNGTRHAECADCHNSHAASNLGNSLAPNLEPALAGATGVDAATGSTPLRPARNEYEVCFKCHANSTNKPQSTAGYTVFGRTPSRQTFSAVADPHNIRLDLTSSVSFHPVTQPIGKTVTQLPSLRTNMLNLDGSTGRALTVGSYIYCTDCHSSDQARSSNGTGPNGPHGSQWTHLLERRFDQEAAGGGGVSFVAGITGTAALCYKCHDLTIVTGNNSWRGHSLHVQSERASCSTCHAPHGIQGGATANNPNLVNFDTSVVSANSAGRLQYVSTGGFRGSCYLRCHGEDHNPHSY